MGIHGGIVKRLCRQDNLAATVLPPDFDGSFGFPGVHEATDINPSHRCTVKLDWHPARGHLNAGILSLKLATRLTNCQAIHQLLVKEHPHPRCTSATHGPLDQLSTAIIGPSLSSLERGEADGLPGSKKTACRSPITSTCWLVLVCKPLSSAVIDRKNSQLNGTTLPALVGVNGRSQGHVRGILVRCRNRG